MDIKNKCCAGLYSNREQQRLLSFIIAFIIYKNIFPIFNLICLIKLPQLVYNKIELLKWQIHRIAGLINT